ncbi:D-2-hydroxyacid dehydrogenase [[Clostridium] innocuum]|nr:D-2-hydroxyacid dehydrogenase [Erysipelotrichaceae bacterium]MCR0381498.1 D-2-hydroxyacid dehydrogenase [[Clostridium] innocuum]MCR0413589.1 D-2-hydroxyacid dehydrogenase [[Clostridium] innocuum]MCR0532845.1 D-2-hydroxyacid dehydrogenase [[Clostridium] innocuum]MCR0536905.1 D-2-hydroxyacid dehydrogenase [[Clostridium] innocuum]
MKIVVLDGYTENPGDLDWNGFAEMGEVTVYDRSEEAQVAERIQDADAVIVNKVRMTRELMEAHPKLRYIGVLATGYDVVDIEAARDLHIAVTNVPGYGTDTVAQYAIALLLEVTSRIGHHAARVKEGEWARNADWCFWEYPLLELSGRTMGIIGYGRIGRRVGEIARALGMKILFHDAYAQEDGSGEKVSLVELLQRSDVVSLHCPLTKENDSLINKKTLAMMKSHAILINNARGKLINEHDLAQALQDGTIYAAALDVVREEPIRSDNPLLKCDNCLITPHISWASKEARSRIMDTAAENLAEFLRGNMQNRIV